MSAQHQTPSNSGSAAQDPALFAQSLELLLSPDVANQEYSLRVLINCALNEKHRTTLLEKIGKQGFETLFQSSSEVVQMLAAWLLSHITLDENICSKVVEYGVFEACFPLLYSENVDVQEKGLWICNNILQNDDSGHITARFEIIDKFIKLFDSSPQKIIKILAQVLESLIHKDSCPYGYLKNQETFLACNGISAIAEILAPAFPPRELEVLLAAVDLLSCLTLYNATGREAVADSTTFSWVLTFVASPTTNTQLLEKSLQIAFNVSLEEHLLSHLVSRAAIPILVARLDSHPASRASLEMTLVVLANLMIDEIARLSFRKHGLANALLRVLLLLVESEEMFDNQVELEKTILEIAGNAACDEYLRIEFHSVGAVAHIESLDAHDSPEFTEMISTAVTNLTIPVSDSIIQEWTDTGASLPSTIERTNISIQSTERAKALPKVKSPIIRSYVMTFREILESELSFVGKIRTFIRVYYDTITQTTDAPIPKDLFGPLFLNIQEILAIHADLLQELSKRFNGDCLLGDLFIEFGNKERVIEAYRIFFTGFENSLTILAEQMAKSPSLEGFLAKCDKDKECNGLNFAAFLMMPIQRIKRYSVFLTELQSSILPKDEDYTNSIAAMQCLERKLNEWHKEAQEHAKLAEIKKGLVHISEAFLLDAIKEVLFEGLVVEYQPQGSHHVQIFLFSDIVIVCCFQVNSQKHRKIPYIEHKIKMQMENVIELNSLEVSQLPPDKATGQHMMKFKWPDGESVFYVTDKELQQWLAAIAKARQM